MLVVPRQKIAVPRLSLSQILAMSKDKGPFPVKVDGWLQCTKRLLPDCPRCGKMVFFDETRQDYVCGHCGLDAGIEKGRITQQVAQHNLLSRIAFQPWWSNDAKFGHNIYIWISNDDTGVDEFKTVYTNTANGTISSGAIAPSKNTVSEYWTYTYTFTAPASPRTIRQVGTSWASVYTSYNVDCQTCVTATELSSEIEQSSTETFEVVYKLQFSEVAP